MLKWINDQLKGQNQKRENKFFAVFRERNILNPNEMVMGKQMGGIRISSGEYGNGALICTDKRLIIYKPDSKRDYHVETLTFDQISSIRLSMSQGKEPVSIRVGGYEHQFSFDKSKGKRIHDIINNQIIIRNAQKSGVPISDPDPLLELQMLYARGAISEKEYLRKMMTI